MKYLFHIDGRKKTKNHVEESKFEKLIIVDKISQEIAPCDSKLCSVDEFHNEPYPEGIFNTILSHSSVEETYSEFEFQEQVNLISKINIKKISSVQKYLDYNEYKHFINNVDTQICFPLEVTNTVPYYDWGNMGVIGNVTDNIKKLLDIYEKKFYEYFSEFKLEKYHDELQNSIKIIFPKNYPLDKDWTTARINVRIELELESRNIIRIKYIPVAII